ncbi:MAG: hypothetical protein B6230_07285 [Desulfobacteraceae bacterium 4572_89]|nr:MAG: hypothetical protein B6230_07285 [Desulfobacteraceae bacterium 4572_89]
MSALGLIETKGFIAAIESADAMLKAADVHLLEKTQIGSGLISISVTGEVSAVKASIEAAAAAVKRINGGGLVSEHVIARPYPELEKIFIRGFPGDEDRDKPENMTPPGKDASAEEEIPAEQDVQAEEEIPAEKDVPAEKGVAEASSETGSRQYGISQLKKMNVSELRQISLTFDSFPLDPENIKTAHKKELISAIMTACGLKED